MVLLVGGVGETKGVAMEDGGAIIAVTKLMTPTLTMLAHAVFLRFIDGIIP